MNAHFGNHSIAAAWKVLPASMTIVLFEFRQPTKRRIEYGRTQDPRSCPSYERQLMCFVCAEIRCMRVARTSGQVWTHILPSLRGQRRETGTTRISLGRSGQTVHMGNARRCSCSQKDELEVLFERLGHECGLRYEGTGMFTEVDVGRRHRFGPTSQRRCGCAASSLFTWAITLLLGSCIALNDSSATSPERTTRPKMDILVIKCNRVNSNQDAYGFELRNTACFTGMPYQH
jgi:hypothetical protein